MFERWNEFWSIFRRRRRAEEPAEETVVNPEKPGEEPEGKREFRDEGELIKYEGCPFKLYLHTKEDFSDEQKKYMLHLMWRWYNSGQKEPLSDVSLEIMISFNLFREIMIVSSNHEEFHIKIV